MSRLHITLGYGQTGDIELDPFTQLLTGQIDAESQVRMDKPATWNNTFEYHGIAVSNAPTSDNVWGITRVTWINGKSTRIQYMGGVSWDNRVTLPWPS